MKRRFEDAESQGDLFDICIANPEERLRYLDHVKRAIQKNRQEITRICKCHDSTLLLSAIAFEQSVRTRPTNEVKTSDFTGHARFLRGIIAAHGGHKVSTYARSCDTMNLLLDYCESLWTLLMNEMWFEEDIDIANSPGKRSDSMRILEIQAVFETDVRYGKHECELIQGISKRLNDAGLKDFLGYDISKVFNLIDRSRNKLNNQMERLHGIAKDEGQASQSLMFEAIPYNQRLSMDDIAICTDDKKMIDEFSITGNNTDLAISKPSKNAPVSRFLFYKKNSDSHLILIEPQAAEHSVRKMLEYRIKDHPKLWSKYLQARNEYTEKRAVEEMAKLLGKQPLAVNYYIQHDGKFSERDAIWVLGNTVVILEAKDNRLRDAAITRGSQKKRESDVKKSIGYAYKQTESVAKHIQTDNSLTLHDKYGNILQTINFTKCPSIYRVIITGDDYQHNATTPGVWLKCKRQHSPWVIDVFSLAVIAPVFRQEKKRLVDFLKWRIPLGDNLTTADELEVVGFYALYGNYDIPAEMPINIGHEFADIFDVQFFRELGYDIPDVVRDPNPAFGVLVRDKDEVSLKIGNQIKHSYAVRPSVDKNQPKPGIKKSQWKKRKRKR